jgi:cobyrinic acid a,c-diamide synthase
VFDGKRQSTGDIPVKNKLTPGFMVAAPSGRSGKTVISIGLSKILTEQGCKVQPFKKGPDYIDPSWLSAASGSICRNLDAFLMKKSVLLKSFEQASGDADIALIEGNMGLYDGIDRNGNGSSACLARLLQVPVLFVIDTARMTRSVAALITGYQGFEPETRIAGVILNNVSGTRHAGKLIDAVEQYCKIPVLGTIPRDIGLNISERHLGLIPFKENTSGASVIEYISRITGKHLDIKGILKIAESAGGHYSNNIRQSKEPRHATKRVPGIASDSPVRIGVFLDRAFSFYYPENLDALTKDGAGIVFIDSLRDNTLPEIDALYIGGGFPELYLEELAANNALMAQIADSIESWLPVYAECAGLLYLCKGIRSNNRLYPMADVIPSTAEICRKPQGHGYVEIEVVKENRFFPVGKVLRGHEFHHSRLIDTDVIECACRIKRGNGIDGLKDGIIYKNLFASYTHIHALGTPEWAGAFVSSAFQHKNRILHKYPAANIGMPVSETAEASLQTAGSRTQ